MSARIRSGFSFKTAYGHLVDVADRIKAIGLKAAPLTDRESTFGFAKWTRICAEKELRPIYGAELAVVPAAGEKSPATDFFTFLAIDQLRPLHDLIKEATKAPDRYPALIYRDVEEARGVIKIAGERCQLAHLSSDDPDLYLALSPSLSKGMYREAKARGFRFIACSDNLYPREEDKEIYRVAMGKRSNTQSYSLALLSDEEWLREIWIASDEDKAAAMANRDAVFDRCQAALHKARLLSPPHSKSLREMCIEGAARLGCNLDDPVYSARMDHELKMIAEKSFEDYFFIIADMVMWAKERMIVGPARGSSCGSLVCYLLGITAVDPIPFGLIFERFIDTTRADLPDIDIDFSDAKRNDVFRYAEEKYGVEHVARLGTVMMFKSASALNAAGAALRVPKWLVGKVADSIIERSGGDSRALQTIEDTFKDTDAGRKMMAEFPEMRIAAKLEGHPSGSSQHAAGLLLTESPIADHVAIDWRTKAAMCDKIDAEVLNLLKIDALGLTQLSIFERTLELIGVPPKSGWLEKLPLDDPKAFGVLNDKRFAGIFQFNGLALQSLTKQIVVEKLDDIVSITALARPGPMANGGANLWVKRRTGSARVEYDHPLLEPFLSDTLGIVMYQEQVLRIGREIGDLSWADVTQLRKAMSKSLGKEYFDRWGDPWKVGVQKRGMPRETADKIWDALCLSGDTVLVNPFPNKGQYRTLTLRELYQRGGMAPGRRAKRQQLLSWDGRAIRPFENWGVVYKGKALTYTVKTASGNVLHATKDHKFLMADGSYRTLSSLLPGDHIMSMGERLPSERKRKKLTGRGGHNWWWKLRTGTPILKRNIAYLRTMFRNCQNCRSASYEETHHINFDHSDNRIENLLPVCRKCHKKLHAIKFGAPRPWVKGRTIFEDKIVSIERRKIEDVFDVMMPDPHHNFVASGIVVHNCGFGSWAFNKSHAVAYGLVSYYCCYLKAYYPEQFAAATLDAESDPQRQIQFLREMKEEGIDYVDVDPDHSTDRWSIAKKGNSTILVGPLTAIKGIGPAAVHEIMTARKRGEPLRANLAKKLREAKTELTTLYPVQAAIERLIPDPLAFGIVSPLRTLKECQNGIEGSVVTIAVAVRIAPRDENDAANVAKRGYAVRGPSQALNMFIRDDTDEIFAKINRWKYEELGRPIAERGRPGKSIYLIKGTVPKDFRMISIDKIKYVGELDGSLPDEAATEEAAE